MVTSSLKKSSIFKMFSSTLKPKAGVLKVLQFEERLKLRFGPGLVWTVGLAVETKLRFSFLRRGVDGA